MHYKYILLSGSLIHREMHFDHLIGYVRMNAKKWHERRCWALKKLSIKLKRRCEDFSFERLRNRKMLQKIDNFLNI